MLITSSRTLRPARGSASPRLHPNPVGCMLARVRPVKTGDYD